MVQVDLLDTNIKYNTKKQPEFADISEEELF